MIEIQHSIEIAASVRKVWEVTVAVEEWPLWSPTIRSLHRIDRAPFGLGSQARILQPMQPESLWTVVAFEPGHAFLWETQRRGLRMVGSHRVLPTAQGTLSILGLRAEGLLATLCAPLLRLAVHSALRQENEALKARCEAPSG